MSLGDLPALILVPPLNCLAAACLGAAFHRKRAGRIALAVGLAGLVLFSLPFVSGSLLASLERNLPTTPSATDPPEAIVILSGDENEIDQSGKIGFTVGSLTLERERTGARLARHTGLPILLSGGQIRAGSPTLADLMATSMQEDFGLATQWREDKSQDTWENAKYSANILHGAGINSIYLVTHAWHMRRAIIAFRAAGLKVTAFPIDPDGQPTLSPRFWIPHISSWLYSYYAMHEWIGCFWYALHG